MGSQVVDYEVFIRDIERRRAEVNAKFDAAIAAIRQISAIPTNGLPSTLPFSPEARLQPYRNMSMGNAAIHYIQNSGYPVPNVALAKALEAGGFPHKSKNFPNTLNSILWRRAKTLGDIAKTSEGWSYVGPHSGFKNASVMNRRVRFYSDDSFTSCAGGRHDFVVAGIAIEYDRTNARQCLLEAERISRKGLADWFDATSAQREIHRGISRNHLS